MVGLDGSVVRVLVSGRASLKNSSSLRDFSREMIARGYDSFVVDLGQCSVMDSTFMGILAGVGLKLRELGRGGVAICGANERNEALLRNLGLDHVLNITARKEDGGCNQRVLDAPNETVAVKAETMLAAHEALVNASPENLPKFKDVIDFLKQDLQPADSR